MFICQCLSNNNKTAKNSQFYGNIMGFLFFDGILKEPEWYSTKSH